MIVGFGPMKCLLEIIRKPILQQRSTVVTQLAYESDDSIELQLIDENNHLQL